MSAGDVVAQYRVAMDALGREWDQTPDGLALAEGHGSGRWGDSNAHWGEVDKLLKARREWVESKVRPYVERIDALDSFARRAGGILENIFVCYSLVPEKEELKPLVEEYARLFPSDQSLEF